MCFFKKVLPFVLTLTLGTALGNLIGHLGLRPAEAPAPLATSGGGSPCNDAVLLPGDPEVFTIKEVSRKAVLFSKPEPVYTDEARKNNTTGEVILRVVLSSSGQVTGIVPLKTLPDGLTQQSIAAARRIEFTPAEKDGRRVSQYATIVYNFDIY